MKKLVKERKGQFVIIAVLMIAIMIISIGALMHRAVTYYRHEPWEEYLALMGNIELNSKRLVELSLANYSFTLDQGILKSNLEKWSADVSKIYLGRGVNLNYSLANGYYNVYGTLICYSFGLNHSWWKPTSYTTANATFTLDISSIGLQGYKFAARASLKIMNTSRPTIVKEPTRYIYSINVTVTDENNNPITSLRKENFIISGLNYMSFSVSQAYDGKYGVVYTIKCEAPRPSSEIQMIIAVCDHRGIKAISKMFQSKIETKSPTNTSGQWIDPTYAYDDDSNYARTNIDGAAQLYHGYGFAIPNGSQIISVRVGLDAFTEEDEEIRLYVSPDGGKNWLNSWSSGKLPNNETTFWVDVTNWTDWSAEDISNNMIWTKVEHNKQGGKSSNIYLDWIRVEVTYIPP
ncbi:MAG: hypothetical protein QXW17_01240 [Candidatus Bathyarchaeia archaeon]